MVDGIASGPGAALTVAGVLVLTEVAERVAVRRGWTSAWAPVLYTPSEVPPLVGAPAPEGRAAGLRWWARPDGRLAWRSEGPRWPATARGTVTLALRQDGRVDLQIGWVPRWTAFAVPLVLAGVGVLRGDVRWSAPLAVMLLGVFLAAQAAASSAMASAVRQALVVGSEADDR